MAELFSTQVGDVDDLDTDDVVAGAEEIDTGANAQGGVDESVAAISSIWPQNLVNL